MTNTNSILVNGQEYDAVTGLPLTKQTSSSAQPVVSAHSIIHKPASNLHVSPQRSITLNRKATKRPVPASKTIRHHQPVTHTSSVRTHSDIKKFAPRTVVATSHAQHTKVMDIGPVTHPHVAKAHALSSAKAQPLAQHIKNAHEIKQASVQKAVAATHKKQPLKSRLQPRQRTVAVLSAIFATVLIGGYFTYLNMPSLSVRVAAAQAGISAGYPNYHPDGYALNGPVSFSDGRVSMNFKSNGGEQNFVINQSKSGWNNDAVLDNYVTPKAGSSYIPYAERGLTIYTYDNNAAWVNGGILYTLEGNAPLSSEQIRRIATSLL